MNEAFYHALVIAVALVGMFRGFRKGLTRQVSDVIGFVFGIVAARAVGPDLTVWLTSWMPQFYHPVAKTFFCEILAYGSIWGICLLLFSLLTSVIGVILGVLQVGLMNSLAGAAFSLLKYIMVISLLFDLAICRPVGSPLMHCAIHDDGNLVGSVISLAPALLGTMSAEDYLLHVQLWEARKIS